jgi:hypothetical protein
MVLLKWLLVILGIGLFGSAAALVAYDVYLAAQLRWLLKQSREGGEPGAGATAFLPVGTSKVVRWQHALRLAALAVVPLLLGESLVVVPDGSAGVRVSQIWACGRVPCIRGYI